MDMADYGFTGGDLLLKKLEGLAKVTDGKPVLRVGFLEGKTEADGTPVPMVAAWNEFGDGTKRPPRPFFRNMIAAKGKAWPDEIAKILPTAGFDAVKTLLLMGMRISGHLRQSIVDTNSPPLAPSTIARKSRGGFKKVAGAFGPEKPLVDTGTMLNSVDYEVDGHK